MISLVNYNKGAAIVASRNAQVIAALYTFLGPVIFNYLNKWLFHMEDVITTYMLVLIISTGIIIYIINFVMLAIVLLSFKNVTFNNKGGDDC